MTAPDESIVVQAKRVARAYAAFERAKGPKGRHRQGAALEAELRELRRLIKWETAP